MIAKEKETSPVEAPRPERWSAQQKTEIVLRLLRQMELVRLIDGEHHAVADDRLGRSG